MDATALATTPGKRRHGRVLRLGMLACLLALWGVLAYQWVTRPRDVFHEVMDISNDHGLVHWDGAVAVQPPADGRRGQIWVAVSTRELPGLEAAQATCEVLGPRLRRYADWDDSVTLYWGSDPGDQATSMVCPLTGPAP